MTTDVSDYRVDPLPDPYEVPADVVAGSPMRGRVVHLRAGDPALDRWRQQPGARVLDPDAGLLSPGLAQPWLRFQESTDAGLAAMVSGAEFLRAWRALADDLYTAAGGGAVVVEPVADADLPVARSLYPESLQVAPGPVSPAPLAAAAPPVSPLTDRLIVIVGMARSGTTWLEELVRVNPRVGGLPCWESWLFQQLSPVWRTLVDGPAPIPRDAAVGAVRRFCDAVITATLARHSPGADFFVEKTPMHTLRLPMIAAVYPDAWVVHLLRDARDVARSWARVPFGVEDPGDAAAVWRRTVATVRQDATLVPRFTEVRYEELFADPVDQVARIWSWVGLPVDDAGRAALAAAAPHRVSAHAGTASQVGPGSWRALSRRELAGVYRAAGDALVQEGYTSRWHSVLGRLGLVRR